MRILLVGEYSRLHNSLKEGLIALGHEVIIIASGDNFKKYSVDHSLYPKFLCDFWLPRKIKNLIYSTTKIDLENIERGVRFYMLLPKLKGYDHVQLINSDAIETYPFLSRILYKKLFKNIISRSLLICGDETPVIDFLFQNHFKYSILTPYFENKSLMNLFEYSLKYRRKNYRKNFEWIVKNCQELITSDLDYKIPMEEMNYTVHFNPNPINADKIEFQEPIIQDKIIIFLGINRSNYTKKGIYFFEKALEIIKIKYLDRIKIIITENLPYHEYINIYNKAHILLDQIYSYDQGYNALEAMAKGKVVFTGAETEFMKHYNLTERVAINTFPDVDSIVNELSYLIENPNEIQAIGKRARLFIEKEHDHVKIAKKYLDTWNVK